MRPLFAALVFAIACFSSALAQPFLCPPVAAAAGRPCETFHYHVHFSRLSSNQIAYSLTVVVVLYALDRSLHERRALDALIAGLAIGLSQYFSFAGRIIPLVAIAYVLLSLVEKHWSGRSRTSAEVPAVTVTQVAWIVLGAALAYEILGFGVKPWENAIGTAARCRARSKARAKSRCEVKRSGPRLA